MNLNLIYKKRNVEGGSIVKKPILLYQYTDPCYGTNPDPDP